jgi:hypothetical protein
LWRPGYAIDIEKVLTACAKRDDAVEINPAHGGSIWTGTGTRRRFGPGA